VAHVKAALPVLNTELAARTRKLAREKMAADPALAQKVRTMLAE